MEDFDKKSSIGRSAYLCKEVECVEAGFKGHRLDRALRRTTSAESKEEAKKALLCKLR